MAPRDGLFGASRLALRAALRALSVFFVLFVPLGNRAVTSPFAAEWLPGTDYSALRASPYGSPWRAIAAAARRRRTVFLSVGGSN